MSAVGYIGYLKFVPSMVGAIKLPSSIMDRRLLLQFSAIGIIFYALLVPALPVPTATDSDSDFLERYLANSRRQNRIGLSDSRPPSNTGRTNSARLDEVESRLAALEANYQAIKVKNNALEKKLSEQDDLSQLQRELVSTLKRIVGPVSPSDEQWAEIDPASHRTPTIDERNQPVDMDNSLPPAVVSTPAGNRQQSGQDEETPRNSVNGNMGDPTSGTTGQTSSNNAEEDMREVNEYLGNAEAQLVQLNPSGDDLVQAAAVDFDRVSSNPSLYGKALLHLEEQNNVLRENFEEVLQKFEEFKGRTAELLRARGNNETSSVLQMPENGVGPQEDDRGGFLDEILRDSSPSGDEEPTERANKVSGKVGFSVAASAPQLGIQNKAQIVLFDYVFTNKGDGFKTDNSSFVCETSGYYFFTFSVRSFDNRYLGVMLMKNDEYQTGVFTDSDERSVMESQSIFIHLVRGDAVWLRLSPSSKYGLYSDQYHLTTFSGILIYKGY